MVYRGKPSKGCKNCRERKIKCDRSPNSCKNCFKTDRQCPGYRDETDLLFHDESGLAKEKVLARTSKALKSLNSKSKEASWHSLALQKSRSHGPAPSGIIPKHLVPKIEERAEAFFMKNFCTDEIPPTAWRTSLEGTTDAGMIALLSSIRAVGFAGLVRFGHSPDAITTVSKKYLEAIQRTNVALRSPEELKKDSTLLSVMVLSIFESLAGRERGSLKDWSTHIHGAATLLGVRGLEQLKTPNGLRLFLQATHALLSDCQCHGVSPTSGISQLIAAIPSQGRFNNTTSNFLHALVRLTEFTTAVRHKGIHDPREIVEKAVELEAVFSSFLEKDPMPWSYEVVHLDAPTKQAPLKQYHVYEHYISVQMWNGIRIRRIYLCQLIRSLLVLGFALQPLLFSCEKYDGYLQSSTKSLLEVHNDVIASVPQHLSYMSQGQGIPSSETGEARFLWSNFRNPSHGASAPLPKSDGLPSIRIFGGFTLPWAMYLAGNTDVVTPEIRRWIMETLYLIGETRGVQQALTLADSLKNTPTPVAHLVRDLVSQQNGDEWSPEEFETLCIDFAATLSLSGYPSTIIPSTLTGSRLTRS